MTRSKERGQNAEQNASKQMHQLVEESDGTNEKNVSKKKHLSQIKIEMMRKVMFPPKEAAVFRVCQSNTRIRATKKQTKSVLKLQKKIHLNANDSLLKSQRKKRAMTQSIST